jgi:hypothetical protein
MPQPSSDFHDFAIAAFAIIAATASFTIASGNRHVALSDRMRKLADEWRILIRHGSQTAHDHEREISLLLQIPIFGKRCRLSVYAHRSLYLALIVEAIVFGGYFAIEVKKLQFTIAVLAVLFLLVVGTGCHLVEFWQANSTIELELMDVVKAKRESATATNVKPGPDNATVKSEGRPEGDVSE